MTKYALKIVTVRKQGGEKEKNVTKTTAFLDGTPDDYRLTYSESGDLEGCETVLHIRNGRKISIDRRGEYSMHLVIEKNVVHTAHYMTPAGGFKMNVRCLEIASSFSSGRLRFKYSAETGAEPLGEFEFNFYFSEAEGN